MGLHPSKLKSRFKHELEVLRAAEPGKRFVEFHRRTSQRPVWVKPLEIVAAIVSFAIGVVLAFIPGPAILFFAITAALLAAQSMWVARCLDEAELAIRVSIEPFKRRPS